MTLPKYYNTGTVSVANGATAVTGVGTAWLNLISAGDVFRRAGLSARVASVTSNGALTLAEAWPGTTLSGSAYEIAITYDGPEFQLRTRELLEQLNVLETAGRGIVQKYSTTTADADPGSGYFRLSSGTTASVTAAPLWKQINITREGGEAVADMIAFIDGIRARSDALEARGRIPADYRDDEHWQ